MADDAAFKRKLAEWEKQKQKIADGEKQYEALKALDNMSVSSDDEQSAEGERIVIINLYMNFLFYSRNNPEVEIIQRIKSDSLMMCSDQSMISTEWLRNHLIGTTADHHCITSQKDMELLLATFKEASKPDVPVVNIALMTVGEFDIFGQFQTALNYFSKSSLAEGGQPLHIPFDNIFAWLSYAAQCDPTLLAPPNELAGSSISVYLKDHLNVSFLPKLTLNRIPMAVSKISRVYEVLSVIEMDYYTAVEIALLMYAVAKLLMDEHADVTMQSQAISVFSNIFALEDKGKVMQVTDELAQLFPLLSPDDPRGICSFMDTAILSGCPFYFCSSLFCSYLVYVTGRSEYTPDSIDTDMSDGEISDMYIKLLCTLLEDGLGSTCGDISKKWAIINMFSSSLNPDLVMSASRKLMNDVEYILVELKKQFFSNGRSDLSIVEVQVRELLQRMKRLRKKPITEDSSGDQSALGAD